MKKNSSSKISPDIILPKEKMAENLLVYLSFLLLFTIAFLYFYLFGNSLFFYQENKSLFIFSHEYLQKFAVKPGGLLIYAGNFITQGYFNTLIGSLIVSLFLLLLIIVLYRIICRLSPGNSFSLLLILMPSSYVLFLQTHYFLFIQNTLGYLFVALWFLASIVSVERKRSILILVLFPVFFYLVGSFAWIYVGMYIMYGVIYRAGNDRYFLPGLIIIITFLTFFVFREVIFLQPSDHLLHYPLFFTDSPQILISLSLLIGFFILFPLFIELSALIKVKKRPGQIFSMITTLIIFASLISSLSVQYDPGLTNLMELEKSVHEQDWDAVIRQHEKTPSKSVIGQYYYNLALSETNQLCNRMFFGQQNFGAMSLMLPRDKEQSFMAFYFYYTIGLTSEAHHLAYELMVQHGYTPEIIKMLIKTELINGNYKIAERYINVLKKTLHYRVWAQKYEKMLYNPEMIKTDPELGEKIRLMPKRDFFIATDDKQNIDMFLKENPENKRAFEYKMAQLLLEKDIMAVTNEVKKMKEIGYTSIPRHIEEAVERYINITKEAPDLGGLSVSADTEHRYFQYGSIINTYKGNKALIEKNMKKPEKNTFWYYLQFNFVSHN
jgi:hypothetical protein